MKPMFFTLNLTSDLCSDPKNDVITIDSTNSVSI